MWPMPEIAIPCEPHPLLRPAAFVTDLPAPLGELPTPDWLAAVLRPGGETAAPFDAPGEPLRKAVRDMLRLRGYKPTGRGKPSSEYLLRALSAGTMPAINLAVDACNAVSLRSGFPISVVDAELAREPWRIGVAAEGARYVFNPAGQEIDLGGLPCLFDAEGPCANAVKDAQRTKTHPGSRRTVSVVWGCAGEEARLERAVAWYREVLGRAGAGP